MAVSFGTIKWTPKGKEVLTPLFILPAEFKKNKVKAIYEFSISEEDWIINPYFVSVLRSTYDIQLPSLSKEQNIIEQFHSLKQTLLLQGFKH